MRKQTLPTLQFHNDAPIKIIAGPCQIESEDHAMQMAEKIVKICYEQGMRVVYKSSFDKANRSSIGSARGVGIDKGLKILQKVKSQDYHQRVAGDKIYVKVFCVPKGVEKE